MERCSLQTFNKRTNFTGGRNNNGRITSRHIGAALNINTELLISINKYNVIGTVERIEYDPNRTAYNFDIILIKKNHI